MSFARWWMRVVGLFYVLMFVMAALVKAPIRAEGPPGVLEQAAAGDPTSRFVVDTWVTLGLVLGAFGAALLWNSRRPGQARSLLGAAISIEVAGMIADVYKMSRGLDPAVPVRWLAIHAVIIATAAWALRAMAEPGPVRLQETP